jgi:predicted CopG family antitoxin
MLTKRIPVSEPVWKELAELRAAGQTYDQLLEEMIRERKRQRLLEDVKEWATRSPDDYVSLSEIAD